MECPWCGKDGLVEFDEGLHWCYFCGHDVKFTEDRIFIYDAEGLCIREESR